MKGKDYRLPCEECITRAICVVKKHIICGILYRWNNTNGYKWDTIHTLLPRLEIVLPERIRDYEVISIDSAVWNATKSSMNFMLENIERVK